MYNLRSELELSCSRIFQRNRTTEFEQRRDNLHMEKIAELNKDRPINMDEPSRLEMIGAELQDEVAYVSQTWESGLT
ncbi:hypothetical protein HYC85_028921 [Camellia sinensis]|uniref:Uncharacterized protein n=1 Tax=Camellia sinensis TaxID=4442 RepID=A0A7J7FWG6_CAMSI|nr:hypothetical protein HYC85_028921 [Camellia sinensis]